ncbi:MAG: T9SS type A sorting domain-containing protein [Fibrobacter sp.]|nr:T9SS type A sorting domain-containing protein [Fibrobacter sp.]
MNKKIFTASAAMLAAATMSYADPFTTWIGSEGLEQVVTGLDNGSETSGYWFDYNDGSSEVVYPVEKGNGYEGGENSLGPIITECGGVCGTYKLTKGSFTYNPFIGIGFNIAGEGDNGPTAADASSWGGICIGYKVEHGASLELGMGDEVDADIGYANPVASLVKSDGAVKTIEWAGFKPPSWATKKIDGPTAASQLVAVKFKVQAATGTVGAFNIMSVGPATGGACVADASAISASAAQSSLKAQLSGRTLSFGKTVASAEIVNLQGQVIMTASSVKSMDLSKVQSGVYMVRAAGLSQKIILK